MSIFGVIKSDDKVFTGDQIRIDVSSSFLAPSVTFATVSHEVSTDGGTTWYNVSSKKLVDWIFMTAGTKTISLRLSTTEPATQTFTKDIEVLSIATQNLFSNDSDLYVAEPEIDQYLPKKWSSWNLVHLKTQEYIIDWLDEKGYRKSSGDKYAAIDLLDKQEVKQWAIFKTLEYIYEGNSNIVGDLSSTKRDKYRELAIEKASRAKLTLNYSGDALDTTQTLNLNSIDIRRG